MPFHQQHFYYAFKLQNPTWEIKITAVENES